MIRHPLDTINQNITLRLPTQLKSTLACLLNRHQSIVNLSKTTIELKTTIHTKQVQLSYTKQETSGLNLIISFAKFCINQACFPFNYLIFRFPSLLVRINFFCFLSVFNISNIHSACVKDA